MLEKCYPTADQWPEGGIAELLDWLFSPPVIPVFFLLGMAAFLYCFVKQESIFRLLNIIILVVFFSFCFAIFQTEMNNSWRGGGYYYVLGVAILWSEYFVMLSISLFSGLWITAIIARFLFRKYSYIKKLEKAIHEKQEPLMEQ